MDGGDGDDTLILTNGVGTSNNFNAGNGYDTVDASQLTASSGAWRFSGSGWERFIGSEQDEFVYGESDSEDYFMNGGDDWVYTSDGVDSFDGGSGIDTLSFYLLELEQGVDINLNRGQINNDGYGNSESVDDFENVIAISPWADTLIGDNLNNVFYAGSNDDIVRMLGGDDLLVLQSAIRIADGGTGDNVVSFNQTFKLVLDGSDNMVEEARTTGVWVNLFANTIFDDGFGDSGFIDNFTTLYGTILDDNITGTDGDDTLYGNGGEDIIRGRDGNDSIEGGGVIDKLQGNTGEDYIFGNNGDDIIRGGSGDDELVGGNDDDSIFGDGNEDILLGGYGDDILKGGNHNDVLTGGYGADTLDGEGGADTYVYLAWGESTPTVRDTIVEFQSIDTIDLSAIDADTWTAGNQAFTFIGDADFSGTAGELQVTQTPSRIYVMADINGDGEADIEIMIRDGVAPTADDFLL
ncbi:MAG: hypothetical protein CMK07_00900 [Ponticaulis sp.]|nr:hypothetical protein [Ponticaulis sp.]